MTFLTPLDNYFSLFSFLFLEKIFRRFVSLFQQICFLKRSNSRYRGKHRVNLLDYVWSLYSKNYIERNDSIKPNHCLKFHFRSNRLQIPRCIRYVCVLNFPNTDDDDDLDPPMTIHGFNFLDKEIVKENIFSSDGVFRRLIAHQIGVPLNGATSSNKFGTCPYRKEHVFSTLLARIQSKLVRAPTKSTSTTPILLIRYYFLSTDIVLSWIVITRIVIAHLYTFSYMINLYPILTSTQPNLLLPWLILSFFKNVVLEVIVIAVGLLLWYDKRFSLTIFFEFVLVKVVPLSK